MVVINDVINKDFGEGKRFDINLSERDIDIILKSLKSTAACLALGGKNNSDLVRMVISIRDSIQKQLYEATKG